jgi:hypothetical protein
MLPVTVLCCLAAVISNSPTRAQPTANNVADTNDCYTINAGLLRQIRNLENFMLNKFKQIDAKLTVECPTNFTRVPTIKGCYIPIMVPTTWEDASARCRSLHNDAHLVVINHELEQIEIVKLLTGQRRSFWTAGQRIDPSTNSTFVWKVQRRSSSTSGRNSEVDTTLLPMTYTNWAPQQPTGSYQGTHEACIELDVDVNYAWNDLSCFYNRFPLCEIDL